MTTLETEISLAKIKLDLLAEKIKHGSGLGKIVAQKQYWQIQRDINKAVKWLNTTR